MKSHTLYTKRTPRVHTAVAAILAVVLSGCSVISPSTDVEIGFRNPTVTLAGTTRFDVARFAGSWRTIGCLGTCAAEVQYNLGPDGTLLRVADRQVVPYRVPAPGVLRTDGGETLVVMWVDDGYRTAVVGDADGRWAAILNRGAVSADRVRAATEILDFNGWDVSRLQRVGG